MKLQDIKGGGWAGIAFFAGMIIYAIFFHYQLHYNARYTAVKLGNTYRTAHAVKKVEFSINVAGEAYNGVANHSKYDEPGDDKKRFYVQFSSEFPWINRLLDTIPASVGNPPSTGWPALPTPSEER